MNERVKAFVTIVATAVAFLNAILTAKGMNPIPFSEEAVYSVVSEIVSGILILYAWWKNQNITANAISAQQFLNTLKWQDKQVEEEEGVEADE